MHLLRHTTQKHAAQKHDKKTRYTPVLKEKTELDQKKFKEYLENQMEIYKTSPYADKELVEKWGKVVDKILTADEDLVDSVIEECKITDKQLGDNELFVKIHTIAEELDKIFLNKIIEQTNHAINILPAIPQNDYHIETRQKSLKLLESIRKKLSPDEVNQALTQVSLKIPDDSIQKIEKIATVVGILKTPYVKSLLKTQIEKLFNFANNDVDDYNKQYKNNINMFKKLAMEILDKGYITEITDLFKALEQRFNKQPFESLINYAVTSLTTIKNSIEKTQSASSSQEEIAAYQTAHAGNSFTHNITPYATDQMRVCPPL